MSKRLRFTLVLFALAVLPASGSGQTAVRQMNLMNAGHRIHVTLYRGAFLRSRKQPTVVFESGLGGGEAHWKAVIKQLPREVSAITYERPGMIGSDPDGLPPSPEHIATLLHIALAQVAPPPYILVGHSWGGPLVRAFAGLFPKDVTGMVLVDPTDFNETEEGRRQYIYGPLGHGEDGEQLRSIVDAYYARQAGHFDAAVEAEIAESREERRSDFIDVRSLPMPSIPLVVIATTKYPFINDPHLAVPYDQRQFQQLMLDYRLLSLSRFARSVPDGTLVTTGRSGHYLQEDEPALVAWAIGRVLLPTQAKP